MPWFEILHTYLVLLSFVINITVRRSLWLLLILEKRVVQNLVINVDFAHFRLHALSHFLFETLSLVSLSSLLSELADASVLDKVRQLKGDFVDSALILQIAALLFLRPLRL